MAEDSVCLRCGRCCYLKVRGPNGVTYFTPFRCKHLSLEGLCNIYHRRLSARDVGCLTIAEATVAGCLPSDCPYVCNILGYVGPREVHHLWKDPQIVRQLGRQLGVSEDEIEFVVATHCQGGPK